MKQTAVEWLFLMLNNPNKDQEFSKKLLDKAKEIEKQQIIDAHGSKLKKSRGTTNYEYWYTGEQYYNETFKNTNK
jgi:predicted ATP-grasp superfamily ATP-dependent carboligase